MPQRERRVCWRGESRAVGSGWFITEITEEEHTGKAKADDKRKKQKAK
jgi:hypothetical protein